MSNLKLSNFKAIRFTKCKRNRYLQNCVQFLFSFSISINLCIFVKFKTTSMSYDKRDPDDVPKLSNILYIVPKGRKKNLLKKLQWKEIHKSKS